MLRILMCAESGLDKLGLAFLSGAASPLNLAYGRYISGGGSLPTRQYPRVGSVQFRRVTGLSRLRAWRKQDIDHSAELSSNRP